jgi:hypothetical protein
MKEKRSELITHKFPTQNAANVHKYYLLFYSHMEKQLLLKGKNDRNIT